MADLDPTVIHNSHARQFELAVEGGIAFLSYRMRPDSMVFLHAEVPRPLEGRGLAGRVVRAGLEYARERGLKVVPLCPYVAAYIKKHPEYLDLVLEDYRQPES